MNCPAWLTRVAYSSVTWCLLHFLTLFPPRNQTSVNYTITHIQCLIVVNFHPLPLSDCQLVWERFSVVHIAVPSVAAARAARYYCRVNEGKLWYGWENSEKRDLHCLRALFRALSISARLLDYEEALAVYRMRTNCLCKKRFYPPKYKFYIHCNNNGIIILVTVNGPPGTRREPRRTCQ